MTIPDRETREYTGIALERIKHLPPGGKMGDIPQHLQHKSFVRKGDKKTGGPNMRLLRLEDDKPSLTVTAYIFNKFVHPHEDRYITPREAATGASRICKNIFLYLKSRISNISDL